MAVIGRNWPAGYDNPTLEMIASDLSGRYGFGQLRADEVAYAARLRHVQPEDGRVPREALPAIYFELRYVKGLVKR